MAHWLLLNPHKENKQSKYSTIKTDTENNNDWWKM